MIHGMPHPSALIRSLHRRETGQALVELAFTMPVLVLMLLGAIEFGQATYVAIEVSNAAKAVAAYAAMNSSGGYEDSSGMTAAAKADGYDVNTLLSTPISASVSYACSCSLSTDTCSNNTPPAPPSGCANSHMFVTVNVTTSATFTPAISFKGLPGSFVLHGYAQQEVIP